MAEPFRMTPVYDVLLRGSDRVPVGLYHLQLARAEQLCRLHYSLASITTIKARLKTLTEHGYVLADAIPTKTGRSPYYYTLGPKGMKYLEGLGYDTHDAWRPNKELDKGYIHLEHTLELNDVLIAAALIHQVDPSYHLSRFDHERMLKRRPVQVSWRTQVAQGGKSTMASLIPDAFLDFRRSLPDGSQRRLALLIEHDRGTEDQHHFRRRIRAYITLLRSEQYKELFGVKAITVAFSTFVGPQRLEQMRAWTRAELTETNEPSQIGLMFCFASLSRPLDPKQVWFEPCWYAPYDTARGMALLAA